MAVIVAVSPSSYCLVVGDTATHSLGLAEVVKVYITGSLLQDITNKKDKKRANFFIVITLFKVI